MGDSYKAKTSLDYYCRELENVKFNELGKLTLPDGFLSQNEWVHVNAHVNNAEHMRRLTEVLKRKTDQFGVHDFERFCTILETSGYGDLAFKLKKKAGLPSRTWHKCSQSQDDVHRERSKSKTKRSRSAPRLPNTNPGLSSRTLKKLVDKVSELQKLVHQNEIEALDVKFSIRYKKTNEVEETLLSCEFGNESDSSVDQRSECTSPQSNLSDSLDGSDYSYGSPPGTSTPIPGPHSRNNSHSSNHAAEETVSSTSTPIPGPHSRNNSHSSNHAAEETVSRFLHKHKNAMLEKMVVKEIVGKLSNKDLLSESIVDSIHNAKDVYNENSVLWNHAINQYDFESCLMLCETLESAVGYPKMRKLGKQMREELEELSIGRVKI